MVARFVSSLRFRIAVDGQSTDPLMSRSVSLRDTAGRLPLDKLLHGISQGRRGGLDKQVDPRFEGFMEPLNLAICLQMIRCAIEMSYG